MKYYFNKKENCFYPEWQLENITTDHVEYTEEEYKQIWYCDAFHYVAQDSETKLPKQFKISDDEELRILREKREKECFIYINRGSLWYNHLTDEQKEELEKWYTAWLNVTETKKIPESPSWLK